MASFEPGTVVFQRGQTQDSDSELWDDTALIKAYDNAVNLMKSKMVVKEGDDTKSQDSQKRKRKRKQKKNKRKPKKWKPGDVCKAVYTEDNVLYDAEIVSVDLEKETCIVRYIGYGNEEEQKLSALKVVSRKAKHNFTSDIDTDSCMEWNGQSPAPPQHTHRHKTKSSTSVPGPHPESFGWPEFARIPPFQGMPNSSFPYPGIPNYPSFQSSHPGGLPFIPPPPPPLTDDLVDKDNDALSSMLMSWYMSGYHTGYYQGLKHARGQSSTFAHPNTNR